MKTRNKILVAISIVALFVIVGFILHNNQGIEDSSGVIRIGAILPLTGKYADNGMSVKCGIALAVDELNKSSDTRYEVSYFDTKSEAKNAAIGYNQLRSLQGIKIMITTMSDNSLILKPLALSDKILLLCVASHSEIIVNNENLVFRTCNTGAEETQCIADYIVNNVKQRRVFLYSFNTQAGNDCKKVVEENFHKELVGTCVYDDGNFEVLKSIASPGMYKDANCIIVIGYSSYMGLLIKTIRDNGYNGYIFANVGFNNPSVITSAGEVADTVHFVDYAFPYGTEMDRLRNKWAQETLGEPFSAMSYYSYGVVKLLDSIQTEQQCGGDVVAIGNALMVDRTWNIGDVVLMSHTNGSVTTKLLVRSLDQISGK